MEEGAATVVEVRVIVVEAARGGVLAGEVEAGEEGLERSVAVDEGGEEVRAVLDEGAEREEEEREEEECVEIGCEGSGGLLQQLTGAPEVAQPWVIGHRGGS